MTLIEGFDQALAHAHRRHTASMDSGVANAVRDILQAVQADGDRALIGYAASLDRVELDRTTVDVAQADTRAPAVDPELKDAIDTAIRRVYAYYENQVSRGFVTHQEGVTLGQLIRPVDSVGVYVPGGTATLFTSLIMTAVPALVAGVPRIIVATPPQVGGQVAPEVLYVAHALGVEQVVLAGGAQAVGALAYGTESIKPVDKIGGPGNAYVVEAMRQLYGAVGIVSLPGPTETLVMASPDADADDVAADLLAQAEHAGSLPALVTWSAALVDAVTQSVQQQLTGESDARDRAAEAMNQRHVAYVVAGEDEALRVANTFAPEHLCLHVPDPWSLMERIQHAGGVFMGSDTLEALGDYLLGPSHVMPTGRTARFSSFVNTRDFERVIPFAEVDRQALEDLGPRAVRMAEQEGLPFHANAVRRRLKPH